MTTAALDDLDKTKRLYKDKFVTLYPTELVVKHFYYVPFLHVNQRFPISSIRRVFHKEQSFLADTATVRVYGTGYSAFTPVWWAYDGLRRVQHVNRNVVIKIRGQYVRKGFSVEDMDVFLAALRPLLEEDVGVEYGFPAGLKASVPADGEKKESAVAAMAGGAGDTGQKLYPVLV